MRPSVLLPSGAQQWVNRTLAVGLEKFAYMSSLAIYVYSSSTFMPLAILAKHDKNLVALTMSPFDGNLLAAATSDCEVRVYDLDTELPACTVKYSSPNARVTQMKWLRTQPEVLLLSVGTCLAAWDFSQAVPAVDATAAAADGGVQPPAAPAPSARRSVLARIRSTLGGGSSGGGSSGGDGPTAGWVVLYDANTQITAFDQCRPAGSGASGGGAAAAGTMVALGTADARVILVELDSSGCAVRGASRIIVLPDVTPGSGISLGGGSNGGGTWGSGSGFGQVTDVKWEALSGNGLLLVVGKSGAMGLYDTLGMTTAVTGGGGGGPGAGDGTGTPELVTLYAKQPATAHRFAEFMPGQPGNFLLSSSRSGALQLWNVSQNQPLRLFKLGGALVQSVSLMPAAQRRSGGTADAPHAAAAGGAGGRGGAGKKAGATAAGGVGALALVTFGDGGVCAYDLDRQAVLWRQEGGHTETVFDCRFCTTDPNLLATASFDSSVRVWDVRTGRCVRQLCGAQGILYSVSWNSEGRLLAASNDSGVVFVYDYSRGMLVKSLHQHTKQSLKVAFHPTKPNLLASSSIDGTVYVYTTDGETVRTLKHFTAVSCLAWSPLAPDTLATTCETGELHVWDVGRPAPQCLVRTLERHSARVFNVEFSPLLQHLLLSSSNDRTARVWDVSTGSCLAVLQGHTAEVRAVAWHPEVAYICFTGSWDAAIRVWDVRSGTCLLLRTDHHADVYGLACHPARPFLLASCSRDTTLRLWSTLPLTPHLLPQALTRPLAQLRAPAEEAMRKSPPPSGPNQPASPPGSPRGNLPSTPTAAPPSWGAMPPPLSGSGSRELVERLAAAGSSATATLDRIIATLHFFLPPAGLDNLCDLLRIVIARGGGAAGWDSNPGTGPTAAAPSLGPTASSQRRSSPMSCGGDDSVGGGGVLQHWTVARVAVASAANHLELAASSKHRGGASRREELLRDAAQQHLVCGNVEHCCELLAETGDWDRALALAPLAGLAFWQRMLRQRVAALAAADAQSHVSDVLPLYLASGAVPDLVQLLAASHMHDAAFNVAAVHACGGYAALGEQAHAPPAPAAPAPAADWQGPTPSSPGAAEWARAAAPQPQVPQALDAFGLPNGYPSVATAASHSAIGALTSQGSGGGGGANGNGAAFPAGGAPAALPPVSLRPGTLPALQRAPSLRPPPLAPIHTTSSSSGGAPQPNAHGMWSPTRSSEPPSPPSHVAPSPPPPSQPAPLSGPTPTPPSGLRSGPSSRYRISTTNTPAANTNTGATGGNAGGSLAAPGREAFDRVVSVRLSQAQSYLSQGLPLHAACCALSVDDLVGAVGLLMRGAAEDVALAVVLAAGAAGASGGGAAGGGAGMLQGVRSQVLLAAAKRSEASEDYLTAAELLKQVPGKSELQQLLAGRCRSHTDPPTAAAVFRSLGLRDPQQYTAGTNTSTTAVSEADVWDSVRQLLLAGEQVAAAQRVVACVRRLIDSGCRVTLTAPEWEAAWTALNSLCPDALPRALWAEAFGQALYAGALAALEAGYAAVGLYLVRRMEEWTAETGCLPAVSLARLAAEASEALDGLLQRPAMAVAPNQARELLAELVAAPPGSAWVQGMLKSRLASLAVPGATSAPPSPHAPASAQQYSTLRCQPLSLSHSLPASGSDGLPVSPNATAGPSSALGRTSSNRRLAAGGGGSGSFGGPLGARFAALDLGASSRSSGGATIAMGAALAGSPGGAGVGACMDHGHVPEGAAGRAVQGRPGSAHGAGAGAVTHADLACGTVVAAAAHVPSRPAGSSGALPTSVVSGAPVRGAALVLDDGESYVSVSEAIMLRRVMSYSPLGTGKLLRLP